MPQQEQAVPALRFSEFSGDWLSGKLGDLISKLDAGVSVNSDDFAASDNEKGILKTSCVSNGYFDSSQNKIVNKANEILRLKEPVLKDTVIISRMNTPSLVGANAFVGKSYPNLFLPDRLWAAKIKKNYCARWVGILTATRRIRFIFSARGTGTSGSMKNITKGDVLTTPVKFPLQKEQQKIAAFLGAVDEKIAQLQKKKELLENYKKGCMQKLFSQQLRFKDDNGNPFPDWEQHEIDKVFKHNKGYGLSKGAIVEDGKYPCVLYGELYTTYQEKIELVQSYTDEDDGKESEKDDLLVPSSTTTSGIDLANITVLPYEGVRLGGDITIMRPKKPINALFYAYYLTHFKKHEIAKYAQGITIVHLYFNHFKKIKIDYPHPDEQKRMADFLSAIDDKIALMAEELDKAKTFKNGLLQQMFV